MIINKNSMKNNYINIYTLIKNPIYLPIFQRGFAWKPAQTEKILEDITTIVENDLINKQHLYLLDFIGFEENGNFKLADGQQRLITLYILIKCLIDFANENKISYAIKNFTIIYEDINEQKKWEEFNNGKIKNPFKQIYLQLKEYIETQRSNISYIENILMNEIYIYLKISETADDAFDIFEQINAGGKPLTKDEIIKTIINQYSKKYDINLNIKPKDLKNDLISYYKYTNSKKTTTFNNLAIMSFLDKQIIINKTSFFNFKKYIESISIANELPITYIAKCLNRTQLLDIIYTYQVNGINLKTNRTIIEDIILPLFLLSAIFSLTGTNPGGKIKTFFNSIIEDIKNKKTEKDIKEHIISFADTNRDICNISLKDFTFMLKGKTKHNILEALLLMDIVQSNTSGSFLPESINLEHIYPQNPDVTWSCNGWPVNEEEKEEYIYNIGNYLILNEKINKKIQNKYITDKKKDYNKIIPKDKFLQTKTNTVNFDEFEKGKDYINRRREYIAKYIQKYFPCAKVFIK